jgi:16S rRNA (cytosine967-C5)-methyltransferase
VSVGAPFGVARDAHVAGLADRDRRLAHELAAGVLRRRRDLDGALPIDRADARLHDILRLGAYQLRWLTRVPPHAAVSTSVELARETAGERAAKYVNQALRKVGEEGRGKGEGESHPDWLVARWTERFGTEATQRLVAWNDAKPTITLQPAKWHTDTLRTRLGDAGYNVESAPFGTGIQLRREGTTPPSPLLRDFPGYSDGAFIVQDPAHALVCRFAGVAPGAHVFDACAAPGGKAVTLERLGARVTAGDARRERLGRLAETTRRAGVAIRLLCADLEAAPFAAGSWDAVLVDAPCTATGTLARHPDARWRLTAPAIARAAARQRRLLERGAALVRRGGLLIYATCSLESEENTDVVEDFLKRHHDFSRAPVAGAAPDALLTPAGDFQSLPQRDGVDGAYAARLVRGR